MSITRYFCVPIPGDDICAQSSDNQLQKNLIASLELGLLGIGVDSVYTLCCDFIQVLCSFMHRTKKTDVPIFEALRPFLKVCNLVSSLNLLNPFSDQEILFEQRKFMFQKH